MRRVLWLVAVGFVLQAVGAQGQSPAYERSVTPNDRLAMALWRIATSTNTRIGFEATDHTRIYGLLERIPPLSVSSLEDGLNAAVGADDRYEWRTVHDIVVVRPKTRWDDPSDPFNRRMPSVQVANETLSDVLLALRDFIYTDKFAVVSHPSTMGIPVSFQVKSGTVIDVLNELMVASNQVLWIGSFRPLGQPADRFANWDLSLDMRDGQHLNALTSSHPPKR